MHHDTAPLSNGSTDVPSIGRLPQPYCKMWRLGMSLSLALNITASLLSERTAYEAMLGALREPLALDIAWNAGLRNATVEVQSLRAGSLIVEFDVVGETANDADDGVSRVLTAFPNADDEKNTGTPPSTQPPRPAPFNFSHTVVALREVLGANGSAWAGVPREGALPYVAVGRARRSDAMVARYVVTFRVTNTSGRSGVSWAWASDVGTVRAVALTVGDDIVTTVGVVGASAVVGVVYNVSTVPLPSELSIGYVIRVGSAAVAGMVDASFPREYVWYLKTRRALRQLHEPAADALRVNVSMLQGGEDFGSWRVPLSSILYRAVSPAIHDRINPALSSTESTCSGSCFVIFVGTVFSSFCLLVVFGTIVVHYGWIDGRTSSNVHTPSEDASWDVELRPLSLPDGIH